MARNDPQVNIRIPAALKEQLEQAAASEGRSVTAEIVERLKASFPESLEWLLTNRIGERERIRQALEVHNRLAATLEAGESLPRELTLTLATLRALFHELDFQIAELKSMREMPPEDLLAMFDPKKTADLISFDNERLKLKQKTP